MKKNLFFRAVLLFAVAALLLPCLAACRGDGNKAETTTPSQTTATAEPTEKLSDFFGSDAKNYVVIYPTSGKSVCRFAAAPTTP